MRRSANINVGGAQARSRRVLEEEEEGTTGKGGRKKNNQFLRSNFIKTLHSGRKKTNNSAGGVKFVEPFFLSLPVAFPRYPPVLVLQ